MEAVADTCVAEQTIANNECSASVAENNTTTAVPAVTAAPAPTSAPAPAETRAEPVVAKKRTVVGIELTPAIKQAFRDLLADVVSAPYLRGYNSVLLEETNFLTVPKLAPLAKIPREGLREASVEALALIAAAPRVPRGLPPNPRLDAAELDAAKHLSKPKSDEEMREIFKTEFIFMYIFIASLAVIAALYALLRRHLSELAAILISVVVGGIVLACELYFQIKKETAKIMDKIGDFPTQFRELAEKTAESS